jgi:hypothetical protein
VVRYTYLLLLPFLIYLHSSERVLALLLDGVCALLLVMADIPNEFELRGFVRNRRLTALSQYFSMCYFPWVSIAQWASVKARVLSYFEVLPTSPVASLSSPQSIQRGVVCMRAAATDDGGKPAARGGLRV